MPARGGGDSPPAPPAYLGGGAQAIIAIHGSGKKNDPQTVHYEKADANFNAATVSYQLWTRTSMWVRLKCVHLDVAASLAGLGFRPTLSTFDNTGAAGNAVVLGATTVTTAVTDSCDWDFGPDGLLLWVAPERTSAGTPNGALVMAASGYAATDDIRLTVEYEWGEWPE
jgi:hypothetical protein